MPISIQHNGEYIAIRMSGRLTLEELLSEGDRIAELERALPVTPHRVADLTTCDLGDLAFLDLSAFAAKRRAVRLKNPVKSALIAADQVQYGFARMYQTLNSNPNIEIRIFPTEALALAWLRESAEPV